MSNVQIMLPANEKLVKFRRLVEFVINNWTALKLAIEHGFAPRDHKQQINQMISDLCIWCSKSSKYDVYDIEDKLEDFMDSVFNTMLEDGSPREIATLLLHFWQLLENNQIDQFDSEQNALPNAPNVLGYSAAKPDRNNDSETDGDDNDENDNESESDNSS